MQAFQFLTLLNIESEMGDNTVFYSKIIEYLINFKKSYGHFDAISLRKTINQELNEFLSSDSIYINNFADILFEQVENTPNEKLIGAFDDFVTTNIFCFSLYDIQFCEGTVGIENYNEESLPNAVLVKSAFGNLVLNNVVVHNAKMLLDLSSTMIKNKKNKTINNPGRVNYREKEEKKVDDVIGEIASSAFDKKKEPEIHRNFAKEYRAEKKEDEREKELANANNKVKEVSYIDRNTQRPTEAETKETFLYASNGKDDEKLNNQPHLVHDSNHPYMNNNQYSAKENTGNVFSQKQEETGYLDDEYEYEEVLEEANDSNLNEDDEDVEVVYEEIEEELEEDEFTDLDDSNSDDEWFDNDDDIHYNDSDEYSENNNDAYNDNDDFDYEDDTEYDYEDDEEDENDDFVVESRRPQKHKFSFIPRNKIGEK